MNYMSIDNSHVVNTFKERFSDSVENHWGILAEYLTSMDLTG